MLAMRTTNIRYRYIQVFLLYFPYFLSATYLVLRCPGLTTMACILCRSVMPRVTVNDNDISDNRPTPTRRGSKNFGRKKTLNSLAYRRGKCVPTGEEDEES